MNKLFNSRLFHTPINLSILSIDKSRKYLLYILVIFFSNLLNINAHANSNSNNSYQISFLSDLFNYFSEKKELNRSTSIEKFKQEYDIIFFYSSNCGYCHRFAPILTRFSRNKDIKIQSYTANGGKISGFADAISSKAQFDKYGIAGYPTVLIVEKANTNNYYSLSRGYLSYDRLVDNFNYVLDSIY